MNAILLPHDRDMTPDELRGFRIACACMETWGRQIEAHGVTPEAWDVPVPFGEMIRHGGATLKGCARALERSLGHEVGA